MPTFSRVFEAGHARYKQGCPMGEAFADSILDHFGLRIWDPSCVMRIMRGLQSLKLFASGPNPCEVSRVKTPPNSFESNDAYHLPGSFWQAPHVFSQNTWRMPPTLEDRDPEGYNPNHGGSVWINHRSSGSQKGQASDKARSWQDPG